MVVYGAHARCGAARGCRVAVGHRQDVPASGGEATEGVLLPGAVLSHPRHRERMQRLDHERAKARQRKGPIPVDAPHNALRPEQAVIGGVLQNRANESAPKGLHRIEARFPLAIGLSSR